MGILRCQSVIGKGYLAPNFLGVPDSVFVMIARCSKHETATVYANKARCIFCLGFWGHQEAFNLLRVIALDLMPGHIERFIPIDKLGRFHVRYSHGKKLLADWRGKVRERKELSSNFVFSHWYHLKASLLDFSPLHSDIH